MVLRYLHIIGVKHMKKLSARPEELLSVLTGHRAPSDGAGVGRNLRGTKIDRPLERFCKFGTDLVTFGVRFGSTSTRSKREKV